MVLSFYLVKAARKWCRKAGERSDFVGSHYFRPRVVFTGRQRSWAVAHLGIKKRSLWTKNTMLILLLTVFQYSLSHGDNLKRGVVSGPTFSQSLQKLIDLPGLHPLLLIPEIVNCKLDIT